MPAFHPIRTPSRFLHGVAGASLIFLIQRGLRTYTLRYEAQGW